MKAVLEGAGSARATLHASRESAASKSNGKGFADVLTGGANGKTAPEPKSGDDEMAANRAKKPVRAGDFRRSLPELYATPGLQRKTITPYEADPMQVALPTEPALDVQKAASGEVTPPFPSPEKATDDDDLEARPDEIPIAQVDPDQDANDAAEMCASVFFPAPVCIPADLLSPPPPVIPLPTQRGETRSTAGPLFEAEAASPDATEAGNGTVDLVANERPAIRATPFGGANRSPAMLGEARSSTGPLFEAEAAIPDAGETGNTAVDLIADKKAAIRTAPVGGPNSGPAAFGDSISRPAPSRGPISSRAVLVEAVREQRGDRISNPGGEPPSVRVVEAQVFPAPVQPGAFGTIGSIVSAVAGSPEWTAFAHRPAALQSAALVGPQSSPVRTLTIQLHPVELGMVTAKLRGSDERLSIEIQVEKPEAYRQLSTDSEAILKAVRTLGIEIDRVTILQQPQGQSAAGTRGDSAGYSGLSNGDSFSAPGGTRQDGERSGRSSSSKGNHSDETQSGSTGAGTAGQAGANRGVYI